MKKIVFLLLMFFTAGARADDAPPPVAITADDIMPYLQDMISLHRQVTALEGPADNSRQILVSENLRAASGKVINYAFDFARAQSAVIDIAKPAPVESTADDSHRQNLMKVAVNVDQHVKQVQSDLDDIAGKINTATGAKRGQLLAIRDKMLSELKLARAQQDLIQNILSLSNNGGVEEAGLLKRINTLARSLPEIQTEQQRKNARTVEVAPSMMVPQKTPVATGKGIIGLVSDFYSAFSKSREVKNVTAQNAKLRDESQQLLNTLKNKLKTEVKLGDEIAKTAAGDGAESLLNQKKQLDGLVTEFKLLGLSVIPLNQTILWLDAGNKNLGEWNDLIDQQIHEVLHILAIRLIMLAVAIAIPVILSRIAHRVIIKYTRDQRWRRQLQTIRRIVFSLIIMVIIILNLITESGSILTFAGFLTAGLAVALQNVILSIVAYFFFFGRYGVREGDRVTVGVFTGEVIKIGMVRLYLMELAGKDFDFYPTGRMVTFPNSVLFQPAAFTKLVPGTNFAWNEIRIILDPASDYDLASKKLLEAVDMVYAEYKGKIRQQQDALQRATNLYIEIPGPTGYVKFVDAGLAFVVRYPVEINDSSEVHDRITKKLIDAIRAEPELKLAA